MKDVMGHRLDFLPQQRQAELLEHGRRNQGRKIATRNVHLAERGNAHPGHRQLVGGLQHGVEIVIDFLKMRCGQIEQPFHLLWMEKHIHAELLWGPPGGRRIQRPVQIGIADQEQIVAFLQG